MHHSRRSVRLARVKFGGSTVCLEIVTRTPNLRTFVVLSLVHTLMKPFNIDTQKEE